MKSSVVLCTIAFVLVVSAAACVGEDPASIAILGQADGGLPEVGGGDSSAGMCVGDTIEACGASCTQCAAPADGSVACTGRMCVKSCGGSLPKLCGDACVDTTTSAAHCGRCDRACEVGPCVAGACQPFAVASGFGAVHAIDVSANGLVISADGDLTICSAPGGCNAATLKTIGTGFSQLGDAAVAGPNVYFKTSQGDYELVQRCPLTGCLASGPLQIESVVNDSIGRIVAGPNHVAWSRRQSFYGPYIQSCSLPGCGAIQTIRPIPSDASNPGREITIPIVTMGVGPTRLLYATSIYNDATTYLRSCALGATCTTPTRIETGNSPVSALTQYNGIFYGSSGTSGGGNVIWSASDAAPTTRTPLVSDAAGITDIAVDASGIYWVNGSTGKVQRCASLNGCAGGGELLASGQTGATRIRVDTKFVYWMAPTSVMKVAK